MTTELAEKARDQKVQEFRALYQTIRTEFQLRLERRLEERDNGRIAAAIGMLMLAFRDKGVDAEAIAAAYTMALGDLPPWAIEAAVKQFVQGRLERNHAFAPSSAEIYQQALEAVRYEREWTRSNIDSYHAALQRRFSVEIPSPPNGREESVA